MLLPPESILVVIGVKSMRLAGLGCIVGGGRSNVQGRSQGQRKQGLLHVPFPRLNTKEILGPGQEKNAGEFMEAYPMY